ncbi:MAG: PBP1A family penicillin-binding protein [Candidatus Binatus sp.]|jgi:penicillin-binding protein 1B|uniref:PBP1A family penicillin-binding protein n=3 Tax=Candidatus Binatus sp. TaxID=2811406 RepID=UPI003C74112B
MGGGRQAPTKAKANPAKQKRREWRIRGWRVRNLAAGGFLLVFFALGFYLAQLYGEISALIEQRRAAMTSAIFSAPFPIVAGDDLDRSGLLDRLAQLSYSQVPSANSAGEYTRAPRALAIYLRSFYVGAKEYPSEMVRVSLDGTRITGVADSFGVAKSDAMLEPEVIGRLLPGAPAERVEVQLGDLKPFLVKGLLANEDRFFYYHPGIDPIRIVEAAIADLRAHRLVEGASTLTQQLARTFMERRERSFSRKLRELAVAVVLEIRLKKDEILERYINDVPMGEYDGTPIDGMPQAARYFFNKDLSEVTPAEAATLIGMIQAPTLYDPRRHPDTCRKRRDVVLGVMKHAGVIDDATYATALATPIQITKPPGLRRAPYFTDYVTAFVNRIPGFDGHLEGLKVYTTLDTELQADAVDAVTDNIAQLEKNHRRLRRTKTDEKLQTSMVALDANTGAIRAMIGGRDYSESQFNRAANAERQPGSAFKPIVYLAALDPDRAPFSPPLTLASILPDEPITFPDGWSPANYERTYQPQVTVVQALYESLNVPTAYVGSKLGPATIVKTAHEMGIHEDLQAYLPISIGADETTLLELTSAYQVFATEGLQSPPYAVEAVVDAKGHQVYLHEDQENRVIRPSVAYLITGALKAVLRYGTGASAGRLGLDFPAAGKTGTTQDYKDAYFIGYTPAIVCGVWVGFDQPESLGLTGAQAALPAWVQFMQDAAPADPEDFPEPSGITMATIDPESGGLATPACPKQVSLPFLIGTEPTQMCPLHGGIFASAPAAAPVSATMPPPPSAPPQPVASASPSSSDVFGAVGKFFTNLFHH